MVVRFSNPEQAPTSHYNPNPMAHHALASVNGGETDEVLFVPTFHRNNFWERTIYVDLEEGENTIRFGAEEMKNFDGDGYIEDEWPDYPWLRSDQGPVLDRISVQETHIPLDEDSGDGEDPGDGEDTEDGDDGSPSDGDEESPGGDGDDGQAPGSGDDDSSQDEDPAPGGDGDSGESAGDPSSDGAGETESGEESAQEPGSTSDSPLARTGVEVMGLLILAGAAITAGVLLKRRFGRGV